MRRPPFTPAIVITLAALLSGCAQEQKASRSQAQQGPAAAAPGATPSETPGAPLSDVWDLGIIAPSSLRT